MSVICLQGGAEFGPDCEAMDAALVALASSRRPGTVVLAPLAATPGRDYERAGANGLRHFTSLGADAVVAPDVRHDVTAARSSWESASLLVLPGGSPARLLTALIDAAFDELLRDLLDDGVVVMGASAGAMVLCGRTWLPEQNLVADGIGLVPKTLVLPHWDGRRSAPPGAGEGVHTLGIPEQSGVMVVDGQPRHSVGAAASTLMTPDGTRHPLSAPH